MLIGSHVSMKGKEMLLGAAKEAYSFNENVFMIYTGAPQNTRRRPLSDMKIEEGQAFMKAHGLKEVVVHAPYIINLANNKDEEKYQFTIDFLKEEVRRAAALGATQICLHPGSHVGLGVEQGIENIVYGLNQVLVEDEGPCIALETMAGKGTEIGRNFDELAQIIQGVNKQHRLSLTIDTCHLNDAGYDVKYHFSDVMAELDEKIGCQRIKVAHINDSKNEQGAHKDRHENIGFGTIGFEALYNIVHSDLLQNVPKILETPYIGRNTKEAIAPYPKEIEMLETGQFDPTWREHILDKMV